MRIEEVQFRSAPCNRANQRGQGDRFLIARHILIVPGHHGGVVAGCEQERDAALPQGIGDRRYYLPELQDVLVPSAIVLLASSPTWQAEPGQGKTRNEVGNQGKGGAAV
jgi:hypothetical protein